MDLTPEQKQRIDEEERNRAAEEAYRAQVRAQLRTEREPLPSSQPNLHEEAEPSKAFPTVVDGAYRSRRSVTRRIPRAQAQPVFRG
jgi:hypothetical protein